VCNRSDNERRPALKFTDACAAVHQAVAAAKFMNRFRRSASTSMMRGAEWARVQHSDRCDRSDHTDRRGRECSTNPRWLGRLQLQLNL